MQAKASLTSRVDARSAVGPEAALAKAAATVEASVGAARDSFTLLSVRSVGRIPRYLSSHEATAQFTARIASKPSVAQPSHQ